MSMIWSFPQSISTWNQEVQFFTVLNQWHLHECESCHGGSKEYTNISHIVKSSRDKHTFSWSQEKKKPIELFLENCTNWNFNYVVEIQNL